MQNLTPEAINSNGLNIFGHEDPKFFCHSARPFRMQSGKSRPASTFIARAIRSADALARNGAQCLYPFYDKYFYGPGVGLWKRGSRCIQSTVSGCRSVDPVIQRSRLQRRYPYLQTPRWILPLAQRLHRARCSKQSVEERTG